MLSIKATLTLLLATAVTASCASHAAPPRPQTPNASSVPASSPRPAPTPGAIPNDVRWMQNSSEYMAIAVQTYRLAATRVETDARGRAAGSWGVILDADDTVINNIQYQAGLYRDGVVHSPERFTAFVRSFASTAVPGAAGFLARVHALGGRIAIVTNRLQIECADTDEMMRRLSLQHDAVVCRPEGAPANAEKNTRFQAVAAGQTAASPKPIDILLYVGDNIMDFPGASQSMRAQGEGAYPEVGVHWFVLPNPMYGSWQ
jgi:5'-nucleotidase (lipoprotein e(P4) family)